MQETPMLFPITPTEFWKQIRITIDEVVSEKLNHFAYEKKESFVKLRKHYNNKTPL